MDPLLDSLDRLNPSVYLSKPTASPATQTLILCTWMNASRRNIAKYIAGYEALGRNIRIILVTNSHDSTFRSQSSTRTTLKPAIDAIKASHDEDFTVHIFSNGGAIRFCNIATIYRQETGRPFPVRAMLVDSSPGRPTISGAVTAFGASLPKNPLIKLPATALLYVMLSMIYVFFEIITRRADPISEMRVTLNNPKFIDQSGRRIYVYSKEDALVDWRDIGAHLVESEEGGLKVQGERFTGSDHVGHARVSPLRYWNIVQDCLDAESSRYVWS